MKRVDGASYLLGNNYHDGEEGLQQNRERAKELWTQAAEIGSSCAHFQLGIYAHEGGDQRRPGSTTRPSLWLDTKMQEAT